MDQQTLTNINEWLSPAFDQKTREEILSLQKSDLKSLENAFYCRLKFGTGGLRGLMGVGTNRMNQYTVAFTSQGLSNYLKQLYQEPIRVFIGYDTRLNSLEFAKIAAEVFAGNGLQAFLNEEICPTPFTSFSCRFYGCHAAVMITASHNPAVYNGYKVFWKDGGQILPPHDKAILEASDKITSLDQVQRSSNYTLVGVEGKGAYLDAMESIKLCDHQKTGKQLDIVYTNLHGTGITLTPPLLERAGYTSITYVDEQITLDGNFPTVAYPNPEEDEALSLGIQKLEECRGDILIAQDPDADRMRAVIMHHEKPYTLNGNQIASLLLYHVLNHMELPSNGACIKTIVTTELFKKIALDHSIKCVDVLTGFKYISELIQTWEKTGSYSFIFGGEESYGTLFGTFSRDKDAIIASLLMAEMTLVAKLQGKTLYDILQEIYQKYGYFAEYHHSLHFPETKEGREEMAVQMSLWRKSTMDQILGRKILQREDYLTSTRYAKSDALRFDLEGECKLVIRPSGTEPKIKIYAETSSSTLQEAETICKEIVEATLDI